MGRCQFEEKTWKENELRNITDIQYSCVFGLAAYLSAIIGGNLVRDHVLVAALKFYPG